jgi:hypothetical protein
LDGLRLYQSLKQYLEKIVLIFSVYRDSLPFLLEDFIRPIHITPTKHFGPKQSQNYPSPENSSATGKYV